MGISISSVDLHDKSFDNNSKIDVYNKFISMVPVIFVGGIVDICDNRDITLKIKDEFETQGFRCLAITNEAESNFVGCYQFPKKFMSDEINPISQIISLNNLVFELDFRIKPDVIIIKLPNGIMQISNSMHNGFGIYADMIKKVLSPDYFICTIPIDHLNEMSLSFIDKYVKDKFGSNHLVYHLSNVYCNYQTDLDSSTKKTLYLSENTDNLNRLIDNSTYFNFLDNIAIQNFVKSIIEKNQSQISE
jgi:peptide maturation system protein (TIGR04066 family)